MKRSLSLFFAMLLFVTFSFAQSPTKKNNRPNEQKETKPKSVPVISDSTFSYRFEKPNFYISKVWMSHDEHGIGKFGFVNDETESTVERPLELSAGTVEKLLELWSDLDFVNSTEEYNFKKDYSHLGTITMGLETPDGSRATSFSFTTHDKMKLLADEYLKIRNEQIWKFDLEIASKNRPLDTPRIMDRLERYINQKQISDPPHLLPMLGQLSNDERMPLIARNTAKRVAKRIEKESEKDK